MSGAVVSAVQLKKQFFMLVTLLGMAGGVVSAIQPAKQYSKCITSTGFPVTLNISASVGNAAYDVLLLSLTFMLATVLSTVTS